MKAYLARWLGPHRWRALKGLADRYVREPRYRRQRIVEARIGERMLRVPVRHPAVRYRRAQPWRDRAIAVIAAAVGDKYPDGSFLDVGANVGDTAAMMAAGARNQLVLVEPSDYFHHLLVDNVASWGEVRRIEKVLVGEPGAGRLRHWGGTAAFEPSDHGAARDQAGEIPRRPLAEVADADCRFVKIDTDGQDFAIVRGAIDWLAERRPILYLEVEVRTENQLAEALATVDALAAAGYTRFALWDDPGRHLVSCRDGDVVASLFRYLHRVRQSPTTPPLYNFDLMAAAEADADVHDAVAAAYHSGAAYEDPPCYNPRMGARNWPV